MTSTPPSKRFRQQSSLGKKEPLTGRPPITMPGGGPATTASMVSKVLGASASQKGTTNSRGGSPLSAALERKLKGK